MRINPSLLVLLFCIQHAPFVNATWLDAIWGHETSLALKTETDAYNGDAIYHVPIENDAEAEKSGQLHLQRRWQRAQTEPNAEASKFNGIGMVEHAESADYESDRENSALDMSPKRSVEDASGDTQERNSIEESQDHEDDPADEDSSFREIISNSDIGNNPDMITLDDGIEEDIQESLAQETSTSQSAKSGHKHFETSQVSDVNKQRQEQHNQNKSESSIDGTSDSIPETQLEKLEVRPKGGVNLFQIADEEGSEVVFVMEAGVSETESNEAASFPKPSHDLVETGTHSPTPIESGTQVSFKTKTKAIPFSKGATKSKTKTKGMPVPSATKESTLWVGTNSHVNATFQGNGTSLYSSNNSISSFDSEVFLKDKKRTSQSETNNGTMTERDHLLPNSDKTLSVPPEDPSSSSLISNKKVRPAFNGSPVACRKMGFLVCLDERTVGQCARVDRKGSLGWIPLLQCKEGETCQTASKQVQCHQ